MEARSTPSDSSRASCVAQAYVSFVPVSPAHMHGMGWAPQLSPMHGGPHYASLPRSPSYGYFAAVPGHGSPPAAPPPPANGGSAGLRHAASSSRLSDQRPPTARHSRTSSWASNGGAHSSGAGYEAEIAAARRARHGSRPSAPAHQVRSLILAVQANQRLHVAAHSLAWIHELHAAAERSWQHLQAVQALRTVSPRVRLGLAVERASSALSALN